MQPDCCPGFVRNARELRISLSTVRIPDVEEPAVVVRIQVDRVACADLPAIEISTERTLSEQRCDHFALRCGGERAAEWHQVPGQPVGVFSLSVPCEAARTRKVLDDLHMGFGAFRPGAGITQRSDSRQDSREPVAPRIDGLDVDCKQVALCAPLDMEGPYYGVVGRWRNVLKLSHMLAVEVMHLRVVAVIFDQAAQGIVGFDFDGFVLFDAQDGLIPPIEGISRYFAPAYSLHRSLPDPVDCVLAGPAWPEL